jgi:sugar lactone lactonase YvrE
VFFSDETAGTISEIAAGGAVRLVTDRLRRPRGLVWDANGQLLAVAQRVNRPSLESPAERDARGIIVRIDVESGGVSLLVQ